MSIQNRVDGLALTGLACQGRSRSLDARRLTATRTDSAHAEAVFPHPHTEKEVKDTKGHRTEERVKEEDAEAVAFGGRSTSPAGPIAHNGEADSLPQVGLYRLAPAVKPAGRLTAVASPVGRSAYAAARSCRQVEITRQITIIIMRTWSTTARFELGDVHITPGAAKSLWETKQSFEEFVYRHIE